MVKKKIFFVSLSLLLSAPLVYSKRQVIYTEKEIYSGFETISFENKPEEFDQSTLELIAKSEDIIPGFIEREGLCAKFVRANVVTLLGSDFFKKNEIISSINAKINGIKNLPGDKYGIYGNAWDMYHNIQKASGKVIYKTNTPMLDNDLSVDFLNKNSKIGDIVGFYFPDSKYNEKAKIAGAGFTHIGLVVGMEKSGNAYSEPVIAHMINSSSYFNGLPAIRHETMSNIKENFTFNGYIKPLKFEKNPIEYSYEIGDQLIFIKSIMRPAYNIESGS